MTEREWIFLIVYLFTLFSYLFIGYLSIRWALKPQITGLWSTSLRFLAVVWGGAMIVCAATAFFTLGFSYPIMSSYSISMYPVSLISGIVGFLLFYFKFIKDNSTGRILTRALLFASSLALSGVGVGGTFVIISAWLSGIPVS